MLVDIYAKILSLIITRVLCYYQILQQEFLNCSSRGWVTFLKRCYWLVWQEYNTRVTMKEFISV